MSFWPTDKTMVNEGKTYAMLPSDESQQLEAASPTSRKISGPAPWRHVMSFTFLISLTCNLWMLYGVKHCSGSLPRLQKTLVGFKERPQVTRMEGYWAPEYEFSTANETELDMLWKNVESGFGVIALDTDIAEQHGLAPSRPWKLDRSKSVYTFAVYHAMHCLRSLRLDYRQMMRGEMVEESEHGHSLHCFEVIRNELMCTATDAIYASRLTADHRDVERIGKDEIRHCSDWEYLRDWAAEHTAGYIEGETGDGDGHKYVHDGPKSDGWFVPPISVDN